MTWVRNAVLALFAVGIITLTVLRVVFVEPFKIAAGSMAPTLLDGEHIMVKQRAYRTTAPQRGDVVVFPYPNDPKKDYIKRVVAIGGDTIEIKDGIVILNDIPVEHSSRSDDCTYDDNNNGTWEHRPCQSMRETLGDHHYSVIFTPGLNTDYPRHQIPAGQLFVLGDNRDNSHDSRFWGTVPANTVKGRANLIWLSSGPHGTRSERLFTKIP